MAYAQIAQDIRMCDYANNFQDYELDNLDRVHHRSRALLSRHKTKVHPITRPATFEMHSAPLYKMAYESTDDPMLVKKTLEESNLCFDLKIDRETRTMMFKSVYSHSIIVDIVSSRSPTGVGKHKGEYSSTPHQTVQTVAKYGMRNYFV